MEVSMPRQGNLVITSREGLSVEIAFVKKESAVTKTINGVTISASITISVAHLRLNWELTEKAEDVRKILDNRDLIDRLAALPNISKIQFVATDEILIIRENENVDWPSVTNDVIDVLFQYEKPRMARISSAMAFINSHFQNVDH
jgi:hypothetical protein